jgi:hypothetical protein
MCIYDCPAVLGAEFLHLHEGFLDGVTCVEECGNDVSYAGFYPVLPDGRFDEFSDAWREAGELIGCGGCGRVFSQLAVIETEYVQVLFTLPAPVTPSS